MKREILRTRSSLVLCALASAALVSCSRSSSDSSSDAASPTPAARAADVQAATGADSHDWDRLRVGLRLFTGDDGGGATKQTVCPTLSQYFEMLNGSTPSACKKVARGLESVIEEVIPARPSDPDYSEGAPHVKLRATSGAWSGYASIVGLQPAVPIGTTLIVKNMGNGKARLAPRQGSDINTGPELSDGTQMKILHFFPDSDDRPLYVTVISGDHAGQNGWIFPQDGNTADGGSPYAFDYNSASPEPTSDPMTRTYTLTDNLRVFNDVQTCKDASNAMSDDDAYQRLKDAVNAGEYHDFDKGAAVHIVSDPDPNDLWVIVADDNGNQGCASRYKLPGY